jgi:tetratricopeptide (TPR) repeat protein
MDDAMPNAPGVAAEAEAALRRALAARPGDVAVICDLADLLAQTSRGDAASALLAQALRDAPDDASLWFKRGHLAMLAGDLAMARESLERSAALLPGYAPTHQNLGLVAEWSGRLDDAERHFRRALALAPDNLDARFGLGTVLLKARRGDEGWRLYVDGGRRGPGAVRRIPARPWDGAPLDGTLLVDLDQGLGDVLQFIRFAAEARARVGRLVVFCDDYFAPLRTLLGSSPAIDAVLDRGSGAQRIAATCVASELPLILGMGDAAFDARNAYLAPPPARVRDWAARVARLAGLAVGLCWGGNPRPGSTDAARLDARRSLPARALRDVVATPGITFVSLQKGTARAEAPALGAALVDWTDELHDFAETTALMANLDLVVSVDTSVVHAAGATGVPVWMLDRYDNCWRWGTDAARPGWYEGLRVFRQPAFGDWAAPLAALREALAARAG